MVMHSRWAVELEGDERDLVNVSAKLNGMICKESDFFVSRANALYILRSSRWDLADDAAQVSELAQVDIAVIRSCLDLVEVCGPIGIGTVIEFDEKSQIISQSRATKMMIRVYPDAASMLSATQYGRYLDAISRDDNLRVAISSFASDPNWFDIYKCIEALKRYYGGEPALLDAFPEERNDIARTKRTANSYRHAEGVFAPVANPVTLEDAGTLLSAILKKALLSVDGVVERTPIGAGIPNLATPDGQGIGRKPLVFEGSDSTSKTATVGEYFSERII